MPNRVTAGFLIFAVVLVAYALSANGIWATDHATSFVQLDYALWHDHSFALTSATRVPPWSVDDFLYMGQNYSALAPGSAFLALPFAGLGFTIAGGYTAYGAVLTYTELFVAITGAVAAYLVYALASMYFRRSTSVLLGFAFAFSTVLWPWATYFFQSDPSAMLMLLTVYLGVRAARREGSAAALSLLSGFCAGIAFTVDYVNAVVLPIMAVFLLLRKRGSAPSMAMSVGAFIAGALPGFAVIGYYNYSIFGSPFVGTEQSYLHASSVFGSFSYPIWEGLSLDLFSLSRGLLVFAPFLVLGILGFIEGLKRRGDRSELLLFLAVFLGVLIPYSMWYEPTGGLSYGPRFLVAAIPFLLLPSGFIIEAARGWQNWLVRGVYLVGVATNGMAALVTAIPYTSGFNDSPLVSVIIPRFLRGDLDTTWGFNSPHSWLWGGLLIASLGAALPLVWVELARRKESPAGPDMPPPGWNAPLEITPRAPALQSAE